MSNPEKFTAINVEWNYRMMHPLGSPSPVKMRTNPKRVTARCESCGVTFTTDEGRGPGKFHQTITGPGYECQCGNAGTIDISAFA